VPSNARLIKGIVVIAHGVLQHAQDFHELALFLANDGFAVYAMDDFNHGKSAGGPCGDVIDYQLLVGDLICFCEMVREKHEQTQPFFVIGHSMGSMLSVLIANKIRQLRALILIGNPNKAGPGVASLFGIRFLAPLTQTPLACRISELLSKIDPYGIAAPLHVESITSDPEKLKLIMSDRRRGKPVTRNKSAFELLKMRDAMKKEAAKITVPLLQLHGSEDDISLVSGAQELFASVATPVACKEIKVFVGSKHEILNDRDRLEANACILEFINSQTR
jgi:alpha-beta hydrolase superfamily lysophospholipase